MHPAIKRIRRIPGIIVALSGILLISSCESQRDKDVAAIGRAVETMKKLPVPRPANQGTVNSIGTAKGRLQISTCGAIKNGKGEWMAMGPSRSTGFFLLPRAVWVNDIEEARRLLLEDYEKGNLMPAPKLVLTNP
jgi:hypothetical protein